MNALLEGKSIHRNKKLEQPGLVKAVPSHDRQAGIRKSLESLPTQTIPLFHDSMIIWKETNDCPFLSNFFQRSLDPRAENSRVWKCSSCIASQGRRRREFARKSWETGKKKKIKKSVVFFVCTTN